MNTLLRTILIVSALVSGRAVAGERTATLDVENVSCAVCAPIVKRTLSRMPGVRQAALVEQDGTATATVSFDDEQVTQEALAAAVTNAGFPTQVQVTQR
ncbi:mercury transporter [Rhizobium sp. SEMIA 4085]|uniref:Mercuric transporter substrate-binding protein MerP n=1 Tax=Rhizobium gallicum bv. gallicum R602sp TaxID=1041138 RepID=A0A0B4X138_9HYPH|nr:MULTISPECIES: cation transporter [Rhizobium]AJD41649.1 mercuric transporter substrate-binding protein MerP [Rhizobium gallicum bv. gallicum R602sp]NNH28823.1 mercury transporter [Rhizobium sp. SEMIA 4085]